MITWEFASHDRGSRDFFDLIKKKTKLKIIKIKHKFIWVVVAAAVVVVAVVEVSLVCEPFVFSAFFSSMNRQNRQ